jgi:hypothetical protein
MSDARENPLTLIETPSKLKRFLRGAALLAGAPAAVAASPPNMSYLVAIAFGSLLVVDVIRQIADILNRLIDAQATRQRAQKEMESKHKIAELEARSKAEIEKLEAQTNSNTAELKAEGPYRIQEAKARLIDADADHQRAKDIRFLKDGDAGRRVVEKAVNGELEPGLGINYSGDGLETTRGEKPRKPRTPAKRPKAASKVPGPEVIPMPKATKVAQARKSGKGKPNGGGKAQDASPNPADECNGSSGAHVLKLYSPEA